MDRRYLINARKTPRNPPLSIQMNNYFSVIRSFLLFIPCRANAHTRELFLSLESLFFRASVYLFSFSFLSFSLFLFFSSRGGTSTKERCYVKRSSTLFGALFRRRFSSRLYPTTSLPLAPILPISILPLHPFFFTQRSLALFVSSSLDSLL